MDHKNAPSTAGPQIVLEYGLPQPTGAGPSQRCLFRLRNIGGAPAFKIRVARLQRRFGSVTFEPVPEIPAGSAIEIQPCISAGGYFETFEQVLLSEDDVMAAEFAGRFENNQLITVRFQIDYQDAAGQLLQTQMEMQYNTEREAADWLKVVSPRPADSHNTMYNAALADEILKMLYESRPAALPIDSLRGISGPFAAVPAQEWIKTVDVLMQMKYVYAEGVRRDPDGQICV